MEAAFFLCSYELSIKSLHSPWCHLFTEEDAKVRLKPVPIPLRPVLILLNPVVLSLTPGVGVQVGSEAVLEASLWLRYQRFLELSSVPPHLQDSGQGRTSQEVCTSPDSIRPEPTHKSTEFLFSCFCRRSTDAPPEPASILIGHGETLLPLISLLGLYKDKTPPTAANYQSQHGTNTSTRTCFRSELVYTWIRTGFQCFN